jgi:hypothetical protein
MSSCHLANMKGFHIWPFTKNSPNTNICLNLLYNNNVLIVSDRLSLMGVGLSHQNRHMDIWFSRFSCILWHINPLPSNRCVNRRQYNSRCYGTALWTRCFPGNERTLNNGEMFLCCPCRDCITKTISSVESAESWSSEKWEAGRRAGFGNPEEGECPSLETATR